MPISWTKDLETGIDIIDDQHRRIVDYINQLESIPKDNHAKVSDVLSQLVDYTLSHFAFEESLLEEARYKLAKQHKAIHDAFTKRVEKFQERHNKGEDIVHEVHVMLCTWLILHIKREDMAYVEAVKSNILDVVRDQSHGGWFSRTFSRIFK